MERILALDIGTKRIGVAVSDPLGMFAQGIGYIPAKKEWLEDLDRHVAHFNPTVILIGLPLRTNGRCGPEAEKIQCIAKEIADRYANISIQLWDERFTTTLAQQALLEGDVSRSKRREKVDQLAAVLILQNYLDYRRGV
ncbi:MAG TPA: Holliday junction resolvase RuvX [Aminobacterium sp.]|jgi:putative Holliday junction resolvase|uniref:Holliday junction resolvase RuvX n=1 Tax=Aminobacterium TaxID=81466 RepID=UPI000466DAA1|nr:MULTISPECIES: Holliday junction resolvase RuvX [Aminobacterium]HCA40491.1 Holliday junction resolvase RuvX [Aminobacterium sp.]